MASAKLRAKKGSWNKLFFTLPLKPQIAGTEKQNEAAGEATEPASWRSWHDDAHLEPTIPLSRSFGSLVTRHKRRAR
jgi:hypothetical protein